MNLKMLVVAVFLFTQGCATVHHGRYQEIDVVSDPAGANVEIRCGKPQPAAVTPATIRVPRRADECSVVLTRAGFHPETVTFDSKPSGWVWANFAWPLAGGVSGSTRSSGLAFMDFLFGVFLGGVGFGIDALTAAMWEFDPARVERKLVPQ